MSDFIDMRSDTVTRPSEGMREAIAKAVVGDDVFEDDPTVKKLESTVAEYLGKEAALYVSSGTMANQVSLRALCDPGDEVICERGMHIINYEVSAAAALSGIMLSPYDGLRGKIDLGLIEGAIRGEDIHNPNTHLLALENTHNRAGGAVIDLDYIAKAKEIADKHNLLMYLDGARLWNAATALNVKLSEIASYFDMVSVCFSKGLGAPVGSAVTGSAENIIKARRIRKMFGGGMRQAGIIASAALYAIEHNYPRLVEDHKRAKRLATLISKADGVTINPDDVDTNIVIFEINEPVVEFMEKCGKSGLMIFPFGKKSMRAVVHLDLSDGDIENAAEIIVSNLS